jgi:hypothetical protein
VNKNVLTEKVPVFKKKSIKNLYRTYHNLKVCVVMVFGIEISDVALFRSEVVLNVIFQF